MSAGAQLLDVEQRSPEWHALRVGQLTGSRAGAMLATVKKGEAAPRRDLRLQLACERVTGRPCEDVFATREMQRGIDLEPMAIAAYEAAQGVFVDRAGYLRHPELPAGCSPDGLVAGGGLVEVKCPKSTTHLRYLLDRRVPPEYAGQVLHSLWITGAHWCDFVSFDDRFPEALQLVIVREWRATDAIVLYEKLVREFLEEVETERARLLTVLGAAA